jgi:hypothetical protein
VLASKKTDLTFRIHLIEGFMERWWSGVSIPLNGCPSIEPPSKRLSECHFLERITAIRKKAKPQMRHVACTG